MSRDHLVENILTLYHLIRRASHSLHRADEITPEQYWLLRHLHHNGARSIGELASSLGVTGSSATTACKRLEKAGLVTRQRQSDDERLVHVVLTSQGQQQLETWSQQRRALLLQLLHPLNEQEQADLQYLLERLLERTDDRSFQAQLLTTGTEEQQV